jgi:protein O-mannosyl-transferase
VTAPPAPPRRLAGSPTALTGTIDAAIAAVLLLSTVLLYAPVRHHAFLNFDDGDYVTENLSVRAGLTAASIRWALTSAHQATWHPLTSLSHLLDVEIFGLHAGAHLLVNVALHALATAVLFLVLRAMTGTRWASAWVAGMFAWHPLHVESVAWVSERKDVLSGLLWMLTLAGYVAYVRRPTRGRWLAVLVVFALGLLAKPMLVTLPLVLLLLDAWPLGRLTRATAARRLLEKTPLFVLAAAVSVITVVAQQRAGAIGTLTSTPVSYRVGNALVSYVTYLRKTVWPSDLAVFYPAVSTLEVTTAALAAAVLAAITALALRERARRPYLLVGWLWYLGTLVPVLGLVRQGDQAMADRFTYLPLIGIFIAVAWSVESLVSLRRRPLLGAAAALSLAACMLLTARQLRHWESSITLFTHALAVTRAVTRDNPVAHTNLGAALALRGHVDEAMAHYREAIAIAPGNAATHLSLGLAHARLGDLDAAIASYREAIRLDPRSALAEYNWGHLLAERGDLDGAIVHYERALVIDPRYAKAHNNLGWALAAQGKLEAAVERYREAIALDPDLVAAHNNLAVALEGLGRTDDALEQYRRTVELAPDEARAHANYAALLAGRGRVDEAIAAYREAVRLAPGVVEIRGALATTYADAGRPRDALAEAEAALALARTRGNAEMTRELERLVAVYRTAAASAP